MPTKRGMLLDEIDQWREEGILDEHTHRVLRSRYENTVRSPEMDREIFAPISAVKAPPGAPTDAAPESSAAPRSFAADSMQFVGGLLVGAGLVALVIFLDLQASAPYILLLLGALLLAPAMVGAFRGSHPGLVEAGLAGGLVPMLVGVARSMDFPASDLVVPLLVAVVCIGVVALRRGEGASTLVAGGGFAWTLAAATVLRDRGTFGSAEQATLWFLSLCAFAVLLAVWRGKRWTEITLAVLVLPATIALVLLLQPYELAYLGTQLAIAVWLAPVLALGILFRSRGLVTGAAAGLTLDAIAFSFEVGGAGTAVVVLLALGGLLVWQAEAVRRYYRPRTSRH